MVMTSSMLMLEVVRRCDLASAAEGGREAVSVSTPASSKVATDNGEGAGESANLTEFLLDRLLKWAGGGREPVGRAGRLERRSCR